MSSEQAIVAGDVSVEQFIEQLSVLSDFSVERLNEIGYRGYALSLLNEGLSPDADEAALYLEAVEGLRTMILEEIGIDLIQHGFKFSVGGSGPEVKVSRDSFVSELPGVLEFFPGETFDEGADVLIEFEADSDLFQVVITDGYHYHLDYQPALEPDGLYCLERILGLV